MSRLAVVTKCSPRLKVTMDWGCDVPTGTTELYVKRAGTNLEFAAYPALEVNVMNSFSTRRQI